MGVWIYFGLSHAIIGSNPPSIYTHYTGHLSPCYWIYVIYVSTPQYNSINGAFFTINHFSFHTKSKTHAKIYWTQKVLKYQCNVCLYSVWLMYYVSPTALLCAAFDHSINPFSLSLCPICNTVYTLYWQLNQMPIYCILWEPLLKYLYDFYPFNAYPSVWAVFRWCVSCLLLLRKHKPICSCIYCECPLMFLIKIWIIIYNKIGITCSWICWILTFV